MRRTLSVVSYLIDTDNREIITMTECVHSKPEVLQRTRFRLMFEHNIFGTEKCSERINDNQSNGWLAIEQQRQTIDQCHF
jgi:hypothetical protein